MYNNFIIIYMQKHQYCISESGIGTNNFDRICFRAKIYKQEDEWNV